MRVKRCDGWHSPCLTFLALRFAPYDGFPIRGKDETCACVGNFKTSPAWFVYIQKERLLNGVFVRTRLNKDSMLQTNIRRAQNGFAVIYCIGKMV